MLDIISKTTKFKTVHRKPIIIALRVNMLNDEYVEFSSEKMQYPECKTNTSPAGDSLMIENNKMANSISVFGCYIAEGIGYMPYRYDEKIFIVYRSPNILPIAQAVAKSWFPYTIIKDWKVVYHSRGNYAAEYRNDEMIVLADLSSNILYQKKGRKREIIL